LLFFIFFIIFYFYFLRYICMYMSSRYVPDFGYIHNIFPILTQCCTMVSFYSGYLSLLPLHTIVLITYLGTHKIHLTVLHAQQVQKHTKHSIYTTTTRGYFGKFNYFMSIFGWVAIYVTLRKCIYWSY
jgi:hypothetical protein